MQAQTGLLGGITALNSGTISNCYSLVKLTAKNMVTGGVVGENIGDISQSFYKGTAKRLTGGVSGAGKGTPINAYYFHNEPEDSKQLSRLRDTALAKHINTAQKAEDVEAIGFDAENIWECTTDKVQVLRFIPEKWLFDIKDSSIYGQYCAEQSDFSEKDIAEVAVVCAAEVKFTAIHTAEELINFAQKINEGDHEVASAYIQLEQDIDLGGKEWIPIGSQLSTRRFSLS